MSALSLSEFADRLSDIMPLVMREFSRRQPSELYKGKISFPQLLTLDFINRHTEPKMTDLAHFLKVTTAAVTGIVERLVNNNYVLRVSDPGDRRIIKIKLTAKGEQLLSKITQQRRDIVMHIFGKVSQAEREEYLKILTHIHRVLSLEKNT